jgi:MFS family permease
LDPMQRFYRREIRPSKSSGLVAASLGGLVALLSVTSLVAILGLLSHNVPDGGNAKAFWLGASFAVGLIVLEPLGCYLALRLGRHYGAARTAVVLVALLLVPIILFLLTGNGLILFVLAAIAGPLLARSMTQGR